MPLESLIQAHVPCKNVAAAKPAACRRRSPARHLRYNTWAERRHHASDTGGEMLDLGIAGRKAIVCAASKGLGRACAMALGRAGVDLVITARTAETLEQTAEEIRKETGAKVTAVPGDISTEAGREATLAACPNPDILVNNCGGPPHGDFREWSVEDWRKAGNPNMLTPIMLIKAPVHGSGQRQFGQNLLLDGGAFNSTMG